jgi:dipeptidyl aminopeptidase/acylaminoacyl peptidase
MDLATGKVTTIERVGGYTVPEEGPNILVYQRGTGAAMVPDLTKGGVGAKGKGKGGAGKGGAASARPLPGADVIIRNLADGKERTLADVTEYSLTRDGKLLVYAVAGKKEEAQGVYALDPAQNAPPVVVRSGPGRYARLTWDEKQTQLAFFHTKAATGTPAGEAPAAQSRICLWKRPANPPVSALLLPSPAAGLTGLALVGLQASTPGATELEPAGKAELRPGMRFSDGGGLSFSPDGGRVYVSVSAAPAPPAKAAAPGEEKANVELWHYKDDYIQPIQKVRYNGRPNYRAVFHLDDRSLRQISDEGMTRVDTGPAGDWAVGMDDRPYRVLVGSVEMGAPGDSYLVNARTGERKLVATKQPSPPSFSPGGKYLLSFDGKDWQTASVPDLKRVNLTGKLGVSFVNELHDQPSNPPPYGSAGWLSGDTHVLLYDRYDLWLVAADGSSAKNITGGVGRKTTTQLRAVRLDPRERSVDPNKPLLVRAESERTRDTGFYRVSPTGAGAPKLLIMGARNYGTPTKAKKGDRLMLTVSTFYDYPDLYTTDMDFREITRVTDANPQKAEFVWGNAELVKYKSADGLPLQGVLLKPEDFDANKKYPMIVYIYERLSQNLHSFRLPQPGTSINPTYYVSNGYLVLMPDIAYTVGYPGQSAVKCVLPAIQAVVDQGCVNEDAIGIQGHSWGGYQTAYLVTQTTRFKAAAAGALVANMTSAYGGIRWGTGLPRQFQYEKTQSRIGGSLWQYPTRFLENSPLFYADRIKTPLLMLHNDRDDAVPWQQGIEFYLALRRLGKEAYLFNYPGELHGLRQRANQKDYTVRMQQFFDHHLKGAPKPEWMAKGLPYTPPPGDAGAGRRGRIAGGAPATPPATEPE